MYQRILVPVDGSEHAEHAAEHAIDLADRYGAQLDVLYVVWTGGDHAGFELPELPAEDLERSLETWGKDVTAGVLDEARRRGVDATVEIRRAESVGRAILEHSQQTGVDLIVMGTHGRRGLERFLLGSVAEHVLREATVPVMTMHVEAHQEP